MIEALPSVYDESEEPYIDKNAQFYISSSQKREPIWFRQLGFNDSIAIRLKHSSYYYYFFDRRTSRILITFMNAYKVEVIEFTIIPGAAELSLSCRYGRVDTASFEENEYEKYYEFLLIFSSVGVLLFHDYSFKTKTEVCVNLIPTITIFKHMIIRVDNLEAVLEVVPESARVPNNWYIVRSIQVGYKLVVKYYPGVNSIISIRLTDKNRIMALKILYTRRMRLDNENKQCVNFGNTLQFNSQMLGKVEIGVFPHQYKIVMRMNEIRSNKVRDCMVYGHHLSPYDIQQTIFDSTNKTTVFYAYYIQPA
ncbi:unnamed protein product [Wuchereria bancrofti]|uniref:Uncharacterized protein n=1 Tax=Wuchereria bancrofti TaxID=6293 RepID=A0A3P7FW60_WUCBA|nr:unnamed protein product [Wuchereria bancrofti]